MLCDNGRCPTCGGAVIVDKSRAVAVCKYCGNEYDTGQAVERLAAGGRDGGVSAFDAFMLGAQRALEFENDFDKAANKYRQALELRPDDYKALWGLFLCEINGIDWAFSRKGFVRAPNDTMDCVSDAVNRYGAHAYAVAPNNVKPYYAARMDKITAEFESRMPKKKKGCYIATAVYGAYDCPQVVMLRRYRDDRLMTNIFGRLFVRVYYALSPIVIRLFGKSARFNSFWRKRLDKKVEKLRNNGYVDAPYDDK